MLVALHVSTYSEWEGETPDLVLVDLTPEFAARAVRICEVARKLKEDLVGSLYSISEFDYSARWLTGLWEGGIQDEKEKLYELLTDVSIVTEKEAGIETIAEKMTEVDDDATTAVYQPRGMLWHAYIKYTNVAMETSEIPLSLLREIAEG